VNFFFGHFRQTVGVQSSDRSQDFGSGGQDYKIKLNIFIFVGLYH
jgi:hypothetical protein